MLYPIAIATFENFTIAYLAKIKIFPLVFQSINSKKAVFIDCFLLLNLLLRGYLLFVVMMASAVWVITMAMLVFLISQNFFYLFNALHCHFETITKRRFVKS